MLNEYSRFCHNQIGAYLSSIKPMFEDLRSILAKAGIDIPYNRYLSMMFFTTLLLSLVWISIISSILVINMGIGGLLLALFSTIIFSILVFSSFYIVPYLLVLDRKSRIKDTLPFATIYLRTLVGTGTPMAEVFENLSEVDEYGEISKEAEKIKNDLQTFNLSIGEAIENSIDRSPSEEYQKLMWGLNHTLNTGGSVDEYLSNKSEELMQQYKRRVEEFSDQLSLVIEIYITLVIIGSILFSTMGAIISIVSPGIGSNTIVLVQALSIFFVLPLLSAMFIILIDGMAPGGIR